MMLLFFAFLIACGDKNGSESEVPTESAIETSDEPAVEPSTESDTDPSVEVSSEPAGEPSSEPGAEPSVEDTANDAECMDLGVDQCTERNDCIVITGRPAEVDEENECYIVSSGTTDVGCMSADMGCASVITFAQDPAVGNCTWFSSGCIPTGWETCQMNFPECQ